MYIGLEWEYLTRSAGMPSGVGRGQKSAKMVFSLNILRNIIGRDKFFLQIKLLTSSSAIAERPRCRVG